MPSVTNNCRARKLAILLMTCTMLVLAGCAQTQPDGFPDQRQSVSQSPAYPAPSQTATLATDGKEQPKHFSQLAADLKLITAAGYQRLCLFDLKDLGDYANPQYTQLLKRYADSGLQITLYAQDMEPNQATVELAKSIGASAVIVDDRNLLTLFRQAGLRTLWWSVVAYPPSHSHWPTYKDWLDLRSAQVRHDLAQWAVDVPPEVDGGLSLDYIRWNQVDNQRTADQVTDLVKQIRAHWNALGRGPLSAAVYPYLGRSSQDGGARAKGQLWNEWLKSGLIDWAYPMAYNSADIPGQIQEWKSYDRAKIVPCLSIKNYN